MSIPLSGDLLAYTCVISTEGRASTVQSGVMMLICSWILVLTISKVYNIHNSFCFNRQILQYYVYLSAAGGMVKANA